MPKDDDELFGKVFGTLLGWTLVGAVTGTYHLAKYLWRFLTFTGLWALLVVAFLHYMLKEFLDYMVLRDEPDSYLIIETVFSLIDTINALWIPALMFSVFWTGRNLYRLKSPGLSNEKLNGVFFGVVPDRSKQPMGKPISSDGHILVAGGAGSGKSACIAIPTLKYFWDGRFLAVDIKGELAQKSGRSAAVFNPCNPQALGYDPFYFARTLPNPTAQIRDVALTLVPKSPEIKDPFWVQAAQNILTGHLIFAYKKGATFIEGLKKIQSVPPNVLLKVAATDEQAALFVMQYMDTKKETLAGIMSELSNHIIPFVGDPDIGSSLSKKDIITPHLLEEGTNIFLQIPEHKINQWKSLVALVIQQFLTHFEQRPEDNNTPILLLIDEFARFGKIEGIVNGLATLRSKKITICIIVQSLAQLDAIYGQEYRKIIADNCAYKAVLSATDVDTQKYFSSLVGTQFVQQESFTKDRKNASLFTGPQTVSSTVSMVERAIIKPETFAQLIKMHSIVVLSPTGTSMLQKQRYDQVPGYQPLV